MTSRQGKLFRHSKHTIKNNIHKFDCISTKDICMTIKL